MEILSTHNGISSNDLHEKLHVNKKKYTDTKNHMIRQGFIKEEIKGRKNYLSRADFQNTSFQNSNYTKTVSTNCKNYLSNLKKIKLIASLRKDKHILKKDAKTILDALFIQIDTIHVICTRLEYAQSFGLMSQKDSKFHKSKCLNLFDEVMKSLFSDHKKFKNEIINHYQSQVRTLKFKV